MGFSEGFDLDEIEIADTEEEFGGFDIDEIADNPILENQMAMNEPVDSPLYIRGDTLENGEFSISGGLLREFHDTALHLDKKDEQSFVTIVVQNNYCFVYSINIGIELYAVYGCDYPQSEPLMFSLPLNRVLKLLNNHETVTFNLTQDEIRISKRGMEVNIKRTDTMFEKECTGYVNTLYSLYEDTPTDSIDNEDMHELLTTLSVYSKMNPADERLILLDKKIAYVRGIGYYVYKNFETNSKYIINAVFANLLLKLSKSSDLENYDISIIDNDDVYTVLANNYVLNFPVLDGKFKFNLLGKIKPTKVFKVEKSEFVTALKQIDLYSETDCGMSLQDRLYLQNKTVQGTARVDIHLECIEGDVESATYMFNHDKLLRLLSGIKTGEVILMECNTKEHLYLSDENMSHFAIISVR